MVIKLIKKSNFGLSLKNMSMIKKCLLTSTALLSMLALLSFVNPSTINNLIGNFSHQELQLIYDGAKEDPMRILSITNSIDSIVLRKKARDILNTKDTNLNYLAERLYATVTDSSSMGVGIAAPQVGLLVNLIWVQRFDKEGFPFEAYWNSKILQQTARKQDCLEGCLSIPNRSDTTHTRSYAIMIEYLDAQFEKKIELVEGFTAVIFQHEIDHLNGILYLDHLREEQ